MKTFKYNDGGRADAGFTGKVQPGDCVCRAIAIATGKEYREVYEEINRRAGGGRSGSRKAKSSARNGVHKELYRDLLDEWEFEWTPTMQVGQGCRVHLRADELPNGIIICKLSRHLCCVIDGVVHDVFDPSRDGSRCVYGYWAAPESEVPDGPDSTCGYDTYCADGFVPRLSN